MANTLKAADALAALSDPTRRAIFQHLAARPSAAGELARGLPVSRPAVSQHLRVLKEAGLVRETAAGTRRIYHLDPRGIAAVREWLDALWGSALDAFPSFADEHTEQEKPR